MLNSFWYNKTKQLSQSGGNQEYHSIAISLDMVKDKIISIPGNAVELSQYNLVIDSLTRQYKWLLDYLCIDHLLRHGRLIA